MEKWKYEEKIIDFLLSIGMYGKDLHKVELEVFAVCFWVFLDWVVEKWKYGDIIDFLLSIGMYRKELHEVELELFAVWWTDMGIW